MTKKEVGAQLRKYLAKAIRSLPDVEYQKASCFRDTTTQIERDHDGSSIPFGNDAGAIHIIELNVEEVRCDEEGGAE